MRLNLISSLIAITLSLQCQIVNADCFYTNEIKQIFKKINSKSEMEFCSFSDTLISLQLNNSNSKVMCHYLIKKNQIKNIGFKIFPDNSFNSFQSEIYQFVERKMLGYYLMSDPIKIENELSLIDGTVYLDDKRFNSKEFKSFPWFKLALDSTLVCNVSQDSIITKVSLSNNEMKISFAFKSSYFNISGINKIEADSILFDNLNQIKEPIIKQTETQTENIIEISDSLYLVKGEKYYKEITSDYFVHKSDSGFSEIFDLNFKAESFVNSIIRPDYYSSNINVTIKHKQYSGPYIKQVMLVDLLNSLRTNHELYFGVEDTSSNNISGTLIALNKNYHYLHILYFTTNSTQLFGKEQVYNCDLFSYIPTDNISNLFGDYEEPTNEYLIKIK